jgi:hypothetical protein
MGADGASFLIPHRVELLWIAVIPYRVAEIDRVLVGYTTDHAIRAATSHRSGGGAAANNGSREAGFLARSEHKQLLVHFHGRLAASEFTLRTAEASTGRTWWRVLLKNGSRKDAFRSTAFCCAVKAHEAPHARTRSS